MKKYKHKNGIIGEIWDDGRLHFDIVSGNVSCYESIPPIFFENSDDWKEIVEKDYKILSFKHKGSNHIWKNDSQLKDTFCIVDGEAPFTSLKEINRYPKVYEIHSVKRLSDGEVFTVGDKITHNNNVTYSNGTLTKISIISNAIFLESNNRIKGFDTNMCFISKSKEPLFTTEDGVDMFEGDTVWGISVNSWKPFYRNVCDIPLNNVATQKWLHGKFSTEAKANDYVLMNKPCLSINDVLKAGYLNCSPKFLIKMVKDA